MRISLCAYPCVHIYNTDASSCLSMNYIVFVCIEIDMDVHEDIERAFIHNHVWDCIHGFQRSSLIFVSLCLRTSGEIREKMCKYLFYFLKFWDIHNLYLWIVLRP